MSTNNNINKYIQRGVQKKKKQRIQRLIYSRTLFTATLKKKDRGLRTIPNLYLLSLPAQRCSADFLPGLPGLDSSFVSPALRLTPSKPRIIPSVPGHTTAFLSFSSCLIRPRLPSYPPKKKKKNKENSVCTLLPHSHVPRLTAAPACPSHSTFASVQRGYLELGASYDHFATPRIPARQDRLVPTFHSSRHRTKQLTSHSHSPYLPPAS